MAAQNNGKGRAVNTCGCAGKQQTNPSSYGRCITLQHKQRLMVPLLRLQGEEAEPLPLLPAALLQCRYDKGKAEKEKEIIEKELLPKQLSEVDAQLEMAR